jgi:hypothetical protein
VCQGFCPSSDSTALARTKCFTLPYLHNFLLRSYSKTRKTICSFGSLSTLTLVNHVLAKGVARLVRPQAKNGRTCGRDLQKHRNLISMIHIVICIG